MLNIKNSNILSVRVIGMINKSFRTIAQVFSVYVLCELFRFIRITYFFGAHSFYLSGINLIGPLTGIHTFSLLGLLIFVVRRFITMSLTGVSFFTPLSYYIPTIFASAYWAFSNSLIRFFVPLACIIAFIAHPVGFQVPCYAFYWFIPLVLYFFPHNNLFVQALGSTFVAHAVGSVLWIYILPTVPAYWYALMPLVAVERLVLCSGMIMMHGVGRYSGSILDKYFGIVFVPKKQTLI